jgi:hypothetical protein
VALDDQLLRDTYIALARAEAEVQEDVATAKRIAEDVVRKTYKGPLTIFPIYSL